MKRTTSMWLARGVLAGIACGALLLTAERTETGSAASPPAVRYVLFRESKSRTVGLALRTRSEVKLIRLTTGRKSGAPVTLFKSDNYETENGLCGVWPSHTGRHIIICGNHEGSINDQGGSLWLMSSDGRLKRKLRVPDPDLTTAYVNLQWSSDDSTVSYITDEPQGGPEGARWDTNPDPNSNRLYVQRVQGGKPRLVARRAFASAWLPGSRLLAYTLQQQPGLFVTSADRRRSARVLEAPAGSMLAISADGRTAALASGKSLTLARVPTDRMKTATRWDKWRTNRLPLDVSQMSMSPHGTTLALLLLVPTGPSGGLVDALVTLDLPSQTVRALGLVHDAWDITRFHDDPAPGFFRNSIFISEVTGRTLRWSPDGRWLMMGQNRRAYIAVRADGGKPVPLDKADWSSSAPAKTITLFRTPSDMGQVEWVEVK